MTLTSITLNPGDILMNEGDPSDFIYIIQRGEMEILKNGKVIGSALAGEMIGEMSFLENQPRSATVRAKSNCQVGFMNRAQFDKILKSQDPLIQELVLTLSERLRKANNKLTL